MPSERDATSAGPPARSRRRAPLLFVSWLAVTIAVGALVSPLLAVALPAVVRIPKAKPHPTGTPEAAALFSHRTHAVFACYACHPSVFPQAPLAFTHEDMRRGERCGYCHDGSRASAVISMPCLSCHESR